MTESKARILWITGLSGAGKSTLAAALALKLRATGAPTVVLDGDDLRVLLGAASAGNHGRAERLALARRYSALCKLLAEQGVTVVIATISMFAEIYAANRAVLPGYFEIFLKVPFDELKRRDSKGIYRRYERGELRDVAGLDLVVDEPTAAHFVAAFRPDLSAADLADQIMRRLDEGASN